MTAIGVEPPQPALANVRFQGRLNWRAATDLGRLRSKADACFGGKQTEKFAD